MHLHALHRLPIHPIFNFAVTAGTSRNPESSAGKLAFGLPRHINCPVLPACSAAGMHGQKLRACLEVGYHPLLSHTLHEEVGPDETAEPDLSKVICVGAKLREPRSVRRRRSHSR